ncbi:hypothetical protein AHAS_Ahas20G0262800 [Arachis hypogaea]
MTVEDFEAEWAKAAADYGLKDAMWWNQVYGKKEMWANAFLCKKFCAVYRTTSQCKGINFLCKNFLESKHSMLELVQNLELLVRAQQISLSTIALDGICSLCATLESKFAKGVHATNSKVCGKIQDPIVVRTKGEPKRQKRKASKRKCAKCNKPGHTKRTYTEGRPRKRKRPRQDELDLDQANEGQHDEVILLSV